MMDIRSLASFLVLASSAFAAAIEPFNGVSSRAAAAGFAEYRVPMTNLVYRFALPDNTTQPYDVLVQLIAPNTYGWAALAWGGGMIKSPLTVAWPNGRAAMVSGRLAT
jgi:hypothetical protein